MDQTLLRLAAVARSEGGEELLKRILDAISPAVLPSVGFSAASSLPTPMDTEVSPQQPLLAPAPTNPVPATVTVERPPKPSKGRSRKDRHQEDLLSAGASAGFPEAPPAKRLKKPRRPYSPEVRGASSRNTAPTGSVRSSKGGSGRGHVTGGRHLAADLRSVCAPALSSAPSAQQSASVPSDAPAQCAPQPAALPDHLASSSSATIAGMLAAPASWTPPIPPPLVDGPSSSFSTSSPHSTPAIMPTPDQLSLQRSSGVLPVSAWGAACQSGAPPSTASRDPGFPPASEARFAGTAIQDGRLPAATGGAVAGDSSSSDDETSLQRHGLKQVVWIIGHSYLLGKTKGYGEALYGQPGLRL
ncbi:mucin-7-like [Hyperolius riggenbachi]|uniref:mucin-7-like n=1 Tax=Hyperolius riggenbachi TaxID=752182 RepID=UPI0035A364D3